MASRPTPGPSFRGALLLSALALGCGKDQPPPTTTPGNPGAPAAVGAEPVDDRPAIDPIPEGWSTLTPQIVVADVDAAVDFYVAAFAADPTMKVAGPDGALFHAEITIGDSRVLIEREDDEWMSPSALGWTSASLTVYVDDVDAAFKRAIEAGGRVEMPVADMYWGDRYGQLLDPAGHRWSLATHTEDLSDAQLQQRLELLDKPTKPTKRRRSGKGAPPPAPWRVIAGTPASSATPSGYHTVTIALTVNDAVKALEFYARAFGATERSRIPGPDGRLLHAEVQIGDSVLLLADAFPKRGSKAPKDASGVPPLMVYQYLASPEVAFDAAMGSGAQVILPMQEVPWGDRLTVVTAPDGYGWGLAAHVEAIAADEIARRLQELAGGPPPPAPPPPAPAPPPPATKAK
jgi:uncharacterized glyoxalase superfamily protein PhnB